MRYARIGTLAAVAGGLILWALRISPVWAQAHRPVVEQAPQKAGQVVEVKALLSGLAVDKPRAYKNMLVFPIRFDGKQVPGEWEAMDRAVAAGHLRILEKEQAAVSDVQIENVSDKTIFLMSGEIIKGGKQTRVIRKDTILEARQRATVPVFCVEQHRWRGDVKFQSSSNLAPASINQAMKAGEGQAEVWSRVEERARAMGAPASPTASLDDALDSDRAKKEFENLHKQLGKFSPAETIGIAIADARTGRVIGLEVFGRRDLFENLQDKLVEGYASDLVLARAGQSDAEARVAVSERQVLEFIQKALSGASQYESTPGSGRGIDLSSGQSDVAQGRPEFHRTGGDLHGKGVGLLEMAVHLSIQETHPLVMPARPIVDDRPVPQLVPLPRAIPPPRPPVER